MLAALEQKNREHDEEVMVAKFMAGEHWLKNDGVEQHKEIDRERSCTREWMYSSEQFDLMSKSVGTVEIPWRQRARACAHSTRRVHREDQQSHELFTNYRKFTDEVARLNDKVKQQNEIQELESDSEMHVERSSSGSKM